MKIIHYYLVLLLFTCKLSAQDTNTSNTIPDFGKSITWDIKGESPSLSNMKGKSVIILYFQEWCGICNAWTPQLFKALDAAYKDDQKVIIVALKTDSGSLSDAKEYITSRTPAENWIIGVDENAEYYQQSLGHDKLFHYAWVKPDGSLGSTGHAGNYHGTGKNRSYSLAQTKQQAQFHENSELLFTSETSSDEELTEAMQLAERGLFVSAIKKSSKLRSDAAKEFKTKVESHLTNSVSELTETLNSSSSPADKYAAFLSLNNYAQTYKAFSFGKDARSTVSRQSSQSWLKNEQKAEKAYLSILKKAGRAEDAKDRERLKRYYAKFLKDYPGTYYEKMVKGMK